MLTLSREADYAVRIVVHMAISKGKQFQARTLASATKVPTSFISKILQMLRKTRIVQSRRGTGGGYQLAIDPSKFTLYGLVELVEGPIALNLCVTPGVKCELQPRCAVHDVWAGAQAQLRRTLQGTTVAELARRTIEKEKAFGLKLASESRP